MSEAVLDASALLAYLRDELGAEIVEAAIAKEVSISTVNWAEVLSKVADLNERPEALVKHLQSQGLLDNGITIVPLSKEDSLLIANLRPLTKPFGLSLGDRACLALAVRLNLPVLTTDQIWNQLELTVQVQAIR